MQTSEAPSKLRQELTMWIFAIVVTLLGVYLLMGIQVEPAAADAFGDPGQFSFVCPLNEYH